MVIPRPPETITQPIITTVTSTSTDAFGHTQFITVTASARSGDTEFKTLGIDASAPTQLSPSQCAAHEESCKEIICPSRAFSFLCKNTTQCDCGRPVSDDSNSAFGLLRNTLINKLSGERGGNFDFTITVASLLFGGVFVAMLVLEGSFMSM